MTEREKLIVAGYEFGANSSLGTAPLTRDEFYLAIAMGLEIPEESAFLPPLTDFEIAVVAGKDDTVTYPQVSVEPEEEETPIEPTDPETNQNA